MNKRTRIGLIAMITIMLLLALTIPSLAKKSDEPTCYIRLLSVNKAGNLNNIFHLYGNLEAYWHEGMLINNCTGTVAFGDPINQGNSIAPLADWCAYYEQASCTGDEFFWGTDELNLQIYDPDAETFYIADYGSLKITSDGDFTFYKEYNP